MHLQRALVTLLLLSPFAFLLFAFDLCFPQPVADWTIMHYAAGSNSSEIDLLSDVEEMKQGKGNDGINFILLIDRIDGFSEDSLTLDGNFNDTRMYSIRDGAYMKLDGMEFFPEMKATRHFEANMADAKTLKRFIQYGKKYFPARHYLLILRSHGSGRAMCPDGEMEPVDRLYPSEITKVLSEDESVDILGLDVCSMAGLENLYEWRPVDGRFSASYVIASAPLSGAWAYDKILRRLSDNDRLRRNPNASRLYEGSAPDDDPSQMTPLSVAQLIIEEVHQSQEWSSWGLFDNSQIGIVKSKIDECARLLAYADPQLLVDIIGQTLGYYHNTSSNLDEAKLAFPYLDAYHFWFQISNDDGLTQEIRTKAGEVCGALDRLVLYSYYGYGFLPITDKFTSGKSGVYQIIPQGREIYNPTNQTFWNHLSWFHPDMSSAQNAYGQYSWCADGAIRSNEIVDNFFELLDALFDSSNDTTGGVNNYQW